MRRRLIGLLSCFLVFGACQSSTMTAAKLYEKQGDSLKAKEQWLMVLEAEPDNMEAHYSLGKIYGAEGKYPEMMASFDIASGSKFHNQINSAIESFWVRRYNEGVNLMQQGRLKLAGVAFYDATVIDKERLEAWRNLAVLYYQMDRIGDAISVYRDIVSRSDDTDLIYNLGILQIQERLYDAAIKSLSRLVSIDSLHFEGYVNLAIAQVNIGDLDSAEKNYLRAIELDSTSVTPQYNLGNLYWQQKEYDKAANAFSKAIELDPKDDDALYNLAITYLHLNDDHSALPLLRLLTERTPKNKTVWREIGGVYARQGRMEDSAKAYEREEELK